MKSIDKAKAKAYFERILGKEIKSFEVNIKANKLLRAFILSGGMDIEE